MRPSKQALIERQLRAGDAAQGVFEKLLEPEDVVCPGCGLLIEKGKVGNLAFQAARETMSAIGLGPMSRVKNETEHGDLGSAMTELAQAIEALASAERIKVSMQVFQLLGEDERAQVFSRFLPQALLVAKNE